MTKKLKKTQKLEKYKPKLLIGYFDFVVEITPQKYCALDPNNKVFFEYFFLYYSFLSIAICGEAKNI